MAALVERASRFVILVTIKGKRAANVAAGLPRKLNNVW